MGDGNRATPAASTNRGACSPSRRSSASRCRSSPRPTSSAPAFTEAHLRGARIVGWRAASSLAVTVGQLLRAGEPLVYAYYDGVDKIAHERGFGPFYEAELRSADGSSATVRDAAARRIRRCWSPPTTGRSTSATNTARAGRRLSPSARNLSGEGASAGCTPGPGAPTISSTRRWRSHGDRGVGHQPRRARRRRLVRPGCQPAGGVPPRRCRARRPRRRSVRRRRPTAVRIHWCVVTGRSHLLRCWCRCWPAAA